LLTKNFPPFPFPILELWERGPFPGLLRYPPFDIPLFLEILPFGLNSNFFYKAVVLNLTFFWKTFPQFKPFFQKLVLIVFPHKGVKGFWEKRSPVGFTPFKGAQKGGIFGAPPF